MNWPLETLLKIHITIMAILLFVAACLLIRRGLFHWNKAGFWAWASFLLYFMLNPLFALLRDDLSLYQRILLIAGGSERVFWILIVTIAGIISFFWVYLHTHTNETNWRLKGDRFSLPMVLITIIFAMFGLYSLLTQRAMLVNTGREKIIEGGRFTGQVTGYDSSGYLFLYVPILFLVLSRSRIANVFGWLASGLFILFALPSGWSRFVLVSMLLVLSLSDTLRRGVAWPRWFFIPVLLVFTVALQLRGHTQWKIADVGNEIVNLSQLSYQSVGEAIGSNEASMLATWYIESYATEHYVGYSYSLPVINYLLTSWIPSRIFPQKYFLVDWLNSRRLYWGKTIDDLLYGAKSSLLGSFYNEGGLLGVILLSGLTGFLSRKLDGMIRPQSPLLVRATGIAWLSIMWMVWGSSDTWGVMSIGILSLPTLFLWLVSPKIQRRKINSLAPALVEKGL